MCECRQKLEGNEGSELETSGPALSLHLTVQMGGSQPRTQRGSRALGWVVRAPQEEAPT